MYKFPDNFFWGAATSAYQVEGANQNADWWEWEKRVGLKETSGPACRHYELFREDFALAKELNHNCHRFSIEWSRIEPEEGKFSEQELGHYLEVISFLHKENLEPIVTLHHFTNPLWFAKLGGWQNNSAIRYYLRYVKYVVEALSAQVNYWITINEPLVYATHAFFLGVWPPQEKSLLKTKEVVHRLAQAHIKAYRLIHSIYQEKKVKNPYVSIAKNMQGFVACSPSLKNKLAVYLRERWYNFWFLQKLIRARTLDFIGINYYSRSLIESKKWGLGHLLLDVCKENHHPLAKNSLGWDIYPQGLYNLLFKLKKYNLPVLITENGICTEDDSLRWSFIKEHLRSICLAMQQGVKVWGYIYWSLLDNFEWDKGYSHRFGIIAVDYQTYERKIRESGRKFANVSKTGMLNYGTDS